MIRTLVGCLCAGLLAGATSAADETVTLTDHKPKVGDRTRVTDIDRGTTKAIIKTPDGRDEKIEKKAKTTVYVNEVLAVADGEKKPVKLKRVYETAEEDRDGVVKKLPLHGTTVIIEKKQGKYTFTFDDGKAVDGDARDRLDKEFNKPDDEDIGEFIPKRPLKIGETWKLDTAKLIKSLVKDTFKADATGAVGTGTLTDVYSFGGHKYGVFDLKLEFALTELLNARPIELNKGSKATIHIVGDGNVDGLAPDGTMSMRMSLRVYFDGPGGEAQIKVDGLVTRTTERLPPRKRD